MYKLLWQETVKDGRDRHCIRDRRVFLYKKPLTLTPK